MNLFKKLGLRQRLNLGFFSITLIFMVTFFISIYATNKVVTLTNDIVEIRSPSAQSSGIMSKGVSQALAALRGWILLDDATFKSERTVVWENKISDELARLQLLSANWINPDNNEILKKLEELLPQLERFQNEIEAIAHTPEDIPLLVILTNDASPIAESIIKELSQIINLESQRSVDEKRKSLWLTFAGFRNSEGLGLASLRGFLLTKNQKYLQTYRLQKEVSEARISKLKLLQFQMNQQQRILFDSIQNSRLVLIPLSEKMIKMRQQPDWKLSNYWLATKAAPIASRVTKILGEMKLNHQKLLHDDAILIENNINQQNITAWVSLIMVLLAAFTMSRFIASDIMRDVGGEPEMIKLMASHLAKGDLGYDDDDDDDDDVSTGIYRSLKEITRSMHKVESHAEKISRGDFGETLALRSSRDNLGLVINRMTNNLDDIAAAVQKVSDGDLTVHLSPNSDNDKISISINRMVEQLKYNSLENEQQQWTQMGRVLINDALLGGNSAKVLSENLLVNLCVYLDARVATLYRWDDGLTGEHSLLLTASYAVDGKHQLTKKIALGDGLVGQVAKDKKLKLVKGLPSNYLPMVSSLGTEILSELILFPFFFDDELRGVIELGFTKVIESQLTELLELVGTDIGIAFENARINLKLNTALEVSQQTAEELSVQKLELEAQQQELQLSNKELSEKSLVLGQQKDALESYSKEIQLKAKELRDASKYKSEFLANMSHELRTPLNSLLILSKLLAENEEGNLTQEDIESATVIHECGEHLLKLISEILDLSKIEAGKMAVFKTMIMINSLSKGIERRFAHMAKEKGIKFSIVVENDVPKHFLSDDAKLNQILTNLISNAIKFTKKGSVSISISLSKMSIDTGLASAGTGKRIIFSIKDTGIGIPKDKQQAIFGAFQQADGSTSRTHGGTGLGLSISKSFAEVLGGYIKVESKKHQGSTFTLVLPEEFEVKTDSADLIPNNDIEELPVDAELELSKKSVADKIPLDGKTSLLIIEDSEKTIYSLKKLLFSEVSQLDIVKSGTEALAAIKSKDYSVIVLDLYLSDMTGFELLDKLSKEGTSLPPVIVHTGKDLNDDELISLKHYADNIIIKSIAAPERLIASVRDVINYNNHGETEEKVVNTEELMIEAGLKGRSIMLVDDDMRNTFSLAKVFRKKGLTVHIAPSGEKALEILSGESSIELILMDVMMPNMNGFETIERIRLLDHYENLPVIALTAKAMPGDKQACIDAKANDYLTKPVDIQKLTKIMAYWLGKA